MALSPTTKHTAREERHKTKLALLQNIIKDDQVIFSNAVKETEIAIASASVVDDVDPSAYDDVVTAAKKVINLAKKIQEFSLKLAAQERQITIAQSNCILTPYRTVKGRDRREVETIAQAMVLKAETIYDARVLEITSLFSLQVVKYIDIISTYEFT